MVSWLIVLCLLVIALCRAAPMVVVPVVVKSAIGVVTYPAVPTLRAEGDGLREDASPPEAADQRGYAPMAVCAGCDSLTAGEACGGRGGFDGCSG
jgi:hypothetical protein